MMSSTHFSFALRAAALGTVLFLAACGGGGGNGGTTTPTTPKPNPNPTTTVTACSSAGLAAASASTAPAVVCMLTSDGEIVIALESVKTPLTVANFLNYVNTGFYGSTIFHRVVPGFVVQGGGETTGFVTKTGLGAPITLESNVGLSNLRGTIAMARTSDANSATSQFYFNTVDNGSLDYQSAANPGYAVFGHVISGLATIDAINAEAQLYTGADTPATEVMLYWAKQVK